MLLSIYLFLMIYAPKIAEVYDVIGIVSLIIVIHALIKRAVEPLAVKQLRRKVFTLFGFLLIYAALLITIHRSPDKWQLIRMVRVIVHFMGTYALIRLYYIKYYDRMGEKLLVHIYWAITAHAIIMLLMFAVTPFRYFLFNVMQVTKEQLMTGERVGGLTTSWDALSAIQGFGAIIFPLVMRYNRGIKAMFGSLAFVLILLSILLSGRTGVLFIALFFPITLLFTIKHVLGTVIKLSVAGLFFIVIVSVVVPRLDLWHKIAPNVDRMKLLLASKEEGGGTEEDAAKKLINDYRTGWPKDPVLFFFGNSTSGRHEWFYVHHDPGYILDMYGVGLLGSSVIWLFYIMSMRQAIRCLRFDLYSGLAALIWVGIMFFTHAKVHFFLARHGLTLSSIFLISGAYLQSLHSDDGVYLDEYTYTDIEEELCEQW